MYYISLAVYTSSDQMWENHGDLNHPRIEHTSPWFCWRVWQWADCVNLSEKWQLNCISVVLVWLRGVTEDRRPATAEQYKRETRRTQLCVFGGAAVFTSLWMSSPGFQRRPFCLLIQTHAGHCSELQAFGWIFQSPAQTALCLLPHLTLEAALWADLVNSCVFVRLTLNLLL